MLEPREISKLLSQTLPFYDLQPKNLHMKVWRALLGYPPFVAVSAFAIGTSALAWAAAYGSSKEIFSYSSICALLFLLIAMPLMLIQNSLRRVPDLSNAVVKVALALEKRSDKRSLSKMSKIARFTRICPLVLIGFHAMMVVMYVVWPLYQMQWVVKLPFMPNNVLIFFIVFIAQTAVFTSGPLSVSWIGFYHMEMSVCMATMFRVIGDQFREAVSTADVNELIEIHQRLLDASKTFIRLFSKPLFIVIFAFSVSNILVTYTMIRATSDTTNVVVTLCFGATVMSSCIWSDFLMTSSKSVGFAVYDSDWIASLSHKRKDLSLVLLRSDRPVIVFAGLFGKLQRKKLVDLGKTWYRFVQALMNLE